jgi:hypothetical protein
VVIAINGTVEPEIIELVDSGEVSITLCSPIVLNSLELVLLGATLKTNNGLTGYFIGKMRFSFSSTGIVRFHWSRKVSYLDFTHNLQNLYQSLEGKELSLIKDAKS